jgi:hypothetical protein
MPPALTDHTTCPGLGLIYYQMYTKHRHELLYMEGMAWYSCRTMSSLFITSRHAVELTDGRGEEVVGEEPCAAGGISMVNP